MRLAAVTALALAAAAPAATPEPQLAELDMVEVTAKVAWPIEDYVEFPRYDSVVISPRGTRLATGWGEENFQRRVSIIEYPSLKPLRSGVLLELANTGVLGLSAWIFQVVSHLCG